ncbi:unnamed protein product [Rotaria sp. Silwood2]|nr:unnamed protein product [Rotaria sp. Silwood2]
MNNSESMLLVPKLEYFILKSAVVNDFEFVCLKWLLNNINYVKKLQIDLRSRAVWRSDQMIWKSLIDANFIRQYCLPDQIVNLQDFRFYIRANCQLSSYDIEKIINSFKSNSFFISHQWTNVKCFYNEGASYQHIFSSILDKYQCFDHLFNYHCISYDLSDLEHIRISIDSSVYAFFEQFNKLCPKVCHITIYTGKYFFFEYFRNGL